MVRPGRCSPGLSRCGCRSGWEAFGCWRLEPLHSGVSELSVEVVDQTGRLKSAAMTWLTQHIEKAVRHLGAGGEVRVRVVDDSEMARAHEDFAEVPGTTDVLTFDLTDPEATSAPRIDQGHGKLASDSCSYGLDTDIMVCFDVAERQIAPNAALTGGFAPVERELLLYVVHGVLHCLGMDDHDEAAAAAMH